MTGVERVVAGSALLALVPVVWFLMLRGWRARRREQAEGLALPEPAPAPEGGSAPGVVEAVYVSTTLAGQPFERVVVHGLGARSAASAGVADGALLVLRRGARSFAVPGSDVLGVDRRRGQVGKFVAGRGGLVVVTWRLGEVPLDTALHCRRREDADALTAAVGALTGPADAAGAPGVAS